MKLPLTDLLVGDMLFRNHFYLFSSILDSTDKPIFTLQKFFKQISNIKHSFKRENNPMFNISLFGKNNGFFGKSHSDLARSKIKKAKGTTIFIYTADQSSLLHTFDSANEAAKFIGCSRPTLLKYIRAEKFLIKGYYVTTNEL
jgi:hypothetical protein